MYMQNRNRLTDIKQASGYKREWEEMGTLGLWD